MGKKSRTKGHDFERWVAKELRHVWPDAKRGYQARGGTSEAPDVDGTPFYIECKRYAKKVDLAAAISQAEGCSDGRGILVIHKVDYGQPKVTFQSVATRTQEWAETFNSFNYRVTDRYGLQGDAFCYITVPFDEWVSVCERFFL